MKTNDFYLRFNVTRAERKRLVQAISSYTQAAAKYLGAPTFAYQVDYFTIDRNGTVSFDDRADSEEIERLIMTLEKQGFSIPIAGEPSDEPAPNSAAQEGQDAPSETPPANDTTGASPAPRCESLGLTVAVPLDLVSVENLNKLLEAKDGLIKKALGVDALPVETGEDSVSFPWFSTEPRPEETKAYTHLISALCKMSREQKRITAREKPVDNERYAFRCFLLRLGFIGAEFKEERKILLRNLSGSSAFKSGQRSTETIQPEPPGPIGQVAMAEMLADEVLIQQVNALFDTQ